MSGKHNLIWKGIWMAFVRVIWEQRNSVIFKQGKPDEKEIFHLAQLRAWLWLKHRVQLFKYSFSDWHLNLEQCIKNYK